MSHHHYEYREHAFVGYTEKTKKTKKKCTDVVQMCFSWAEKGECEKNREYMFENCCCACDDAENCPSMESPPPGVDDVNDDASSLTAAREGLMVDERKDRKSVV